MRRADRRPGRAPAPAPSWRRPLLPGALVAVGVAVALAIVISRRSGDDAPLMAFPPPPPVPAESITFEDFIGSDGCAECHMAQHAAWSASTHAHAGEAPPDDLPLRPFDGTPIRFRDATVEPRSRGGSLEFVVNWLGRVDRYPVLGVVGAGHMIGGGTQGFLWRHPDGSVRLLPFEVAGADSAWFCATGPRANRGWAVITDSMSISDCNDFPPARVFGNSAQMANCQECHGSQIELHAGELPSQTRFASLSINCESCHGPGRRHAELARAEQLGTDIGLPSLALLSRDASVAVCLRCHALKSDVHRGFLPGRELEQYYSLKFPLLDGDALHADGRTRTFAYQQGHLYSDCYLSGSMTCVDCHEPHGQQYRDIYGRTLEGRFDDAQCTDCHASKADRPELHTRHAPTSPGSRCTACHMPFVQESAVGAEIRYTRSDHTIPVPRPALDQRLGIINACQTCHQERSGDRLVLQTDSLWGELKPLRPITTTLLEVESTESLERVLLAADTTHALAYFDALARYVARLPGPDARSIPRRLGARLWELTSSRDDDIAALAAAVLHFDAGNQARVREGLTERLRALGGRELGVRRRWAVALGHRGDALRDRDRHTEAMAAYGKALEVLPEDPELLHALGLVHLNAGDAGRASDFLGRAVARDTGNALARVNYGRARAAIGDEAGSVAAYRAAIEVNPYDALAYLYLGNTLAATGRRDDAAAMYRRAIDLDLSLAPAHFNLARMLLFQDRRPDALAAIRRGLLFDPQHADARQAAAEIEAELARTAPQSRQPGS